MNELKLKWSAEIFHLRRKNTFLFNLTAVVAAVVVVAFVVAVVVAVVAVVVVVVAVVSKARERKLESFMAG